MSDQAVLAIAEKGLQEVRGLLVDIALDKGFGHLFDRLIRTSLNAHSQRRRGFLTSPRAGGRMSMFLGIVPAVLCYLTDRRTEVQRWLRIVRHTMNGIQLADDLLDWEEDFKTGILTPVTKGLLRHGWPDTTHLISLTQVAEDEFRAAEDLTSDLGAESWKEACRIWRGALVGEMRRRLKGHAADGVPPPLMLTLSNTHDKSR
jgi:hypothetical protein